MPYIPGVPGITDVYHSPNVFANNVPIALWLDAIPSASIAIPEANTVNLSTAQIEAIASTASQATSQEEKDAGLAGRGEVPQEGDLEETTPDPRAAEETDELFIKVARNLDACLSEANSGAWKETGNNQRIVACYKAVGFNISGDSTPWCAAFAGSILKRSGAPSLKTLSSLAYRGYGTSVPVGDPSQWRLNDVIIFTRKGGGHIGFFRGYNKATGAIQILGGNQSDNLKLSGFKNPSSSMPVAYVGRAWSVPAEYDKPVLYAGSGSSVKVV